MLAKPPNGYGPDDLAMLLRVLKDALTAATDGAGVSDIDSQQLSSRLGKVIMDHFAAGENDREALKKAAVESIKPSDQ